MWWLVIIAAAVIYLGLEVLRRRIAGNGPRYRLQTMRDVRAFGWAAHKGALDDVRKPFQRPRQ